MTRQIPPGRVATFAALGELIDIPARHVAYILATLSDAEATTTPWHRAIPRAGKLSNRSRKIAAQIALLRQDGVSVIDGRVLDLDAIAFVPQLPKGALATRPSDAPPGQRRKPPRSST